eukprot:gene6821-10986_t
MSQDKVWKFGYGSNMSVENMKKKKNLEIFEHTAGILKGFKLIFKDGIAFSEPGFAAVVKGTDQDEVHGTLALISKETAEGLDIQEMGYLIQKVTVETYDNRKIEAEVYGEYPDKEIKTSPPSLRYLRLLIKGAEESNLQKEYIDKLKKVEYYEPSGEVLKNRSVKIPKSKEEREKLKVFTNEELSKFNGKDGNPKYTCCLGFVVDLENVWIFPSWHGRDVSNRNLLHFRGFSLDTMDDGGKTFPKLSTLNEEEIEYLTQNLDRFIQGDNKIIGYLKEFYDFQESD